LPNFPSPFQEMSYGDGSPPKTKKELQLMALSAAIREKPAWWDKVNDEVISSKWRLEARTKLCLVLPDQDQDALFEYALAELRWLADKLDGATQPRASPVDAVYEADCIVSSELRAALIAGVGRIEPGYDAPKRDWHPGSEEQVIDLVHPSLFCFVEGESRMCAKQQLSWEEWLGLGECVPMLGKLNTDVFTSKTHQWLATDLTVHHNGKVQFDSYINNLHPKQHKNLYDTLADVFSCMVPLLERVLSHAACPRPNRISPEYNWRPDQPDTASEASSDSSYSEFGPNVSQPDVPIFSAPQAVPELSLRGRALQVIVKLADIELTPASPRYPGGVWHVEGMRNEDIVATAIYYYDCHNTTASRLSFRTAVCEPDYEQNDNDGVEQVFGLTDEAALNQPLGSVCTEEHRCIAFPNQLQHQVQPFELLDPNKPGHRRILVFFLVNPNKRSLSTADVPPQQKDWLRQELLCISRFRKLDRHILDIVLSHLDYPMSWSQANENRAQLMHERKYMVNQNTQLVFEREFSLCEH